MFIIYHSNQIEILNELLIESIRKEPLTHPLEQEQILVQSPGMAQWVRLSLAKAFNITASVNFPLPASFIWQMFVSTLSDIPKKSTFNKESMTWKLLTLLPQWLENENFSLLKQYVKEDPTAVKLFQLCEKIADTFDQYLVFRPDWIQQWEKNNDLPTITNTQKWQPILWRALIQETARLKQNHWHRANMHQTFLQKLSENKDKHQLPKRLFIFGVSALPPHFLEILEAIGQHINVHLFVCNPCRYYWGDEQDQKYLAKLQAKQLQNQKKYPDKKKIHFVHEQNYHQKTNPLLGSWGKLGRDYLHQLHNSSALEIDAFVDIESSSLLTCLQKDILELNNPPKKTAIAKHDHSITLHSCHSPLREVEVLYDQLLYLFEQDPTLSPKDIIVMFPDVQKYSIWIQAIFGEWHSLESKETPKIPYAISDISATDEHPLLISIFTLLNIDQNRCSSLDLMTLLEIPAIMRQFELSESDIDTIRLWLKETSIRWGITPEHQASFNIESSDQHTWLAGINRMLLGYCIPASCGIYQDQLPFDAIQGMNARLAGQLADFINQLIQWINSLTHQQEQTIDQWIQSIHQLIDTFLSIDDHDNKAINQLYLVLDNLQEQLKDTQDTQYLSRDLFTYYISNKLTLSRSNQHFLAGQVNFCTLMPMRSIPFKVICLLGMNEGAYPRNIPTLGFDLIAQHPRKGDRSRREDDRYLFLEALMAARNTFYISYVGKSITDNTTQEPSVLVSELLNVIEERFIEENASSILTTHHHLQPFNTNYFDSKKNIFSYAQRWVPKINTEYQSDSFCQTPLALIADQTSKISLSEIIRFFHNPCKAFFNQRLQVYFEQQEQQLLEVEPFNVEGLEAYILKKSVLDALINEENNTHILKKFIAKGELPHGVFAQLKVEQLIDELSPMVELIKPLITQPMNPIEVDLSFNNFHLIGSLKYCYHQQLIRYRPAKIKAIDIFSAWIEHLCYNLVAQSIDGTHLIALDDQIQFHPIDKATCERYLTDLMTIYQQGLLTPLPLFIQTAWVYMKNIEKDNVKALAYQCFHGGYQYQGEINDAYIHRCYPDFESVFNQFKLITTQVMMPIIDHLK